MVNSWLNIWVSYMWTAVEETKIEAILAVMNTTQLVVKLRPENNSGPYEIWTHDLWNTDATVFFFFSIFFICTFLWQIIDEPPIKSIATSPKWFTSPATSFPCILSVFSDSFWPFKKNCCIGRGTGSQRSALPKNTAKLPWLQLEPPPQIEDLDKHT